MSELAINANGTTFEVPGTVSAWRVRYMKANGAAELVYGHDGRPLTVPVGSTTDDLRDAVGMPGTYQLDPIDRHGKYVDGVAPAYVQVQRSADALRDAAQLNTELAKLIIECFPGLMTAAAELLRGAPRQSTKSKSKAKTKAYKR